MWNLLYSNEGTCLKFILNTGTAKNPRLCSSQKHTPDCSVPPSQTQITLRLCHQQTPQPIPFLQEHPAHPRTFHGCPGNEGCFAISSRSSEQQPKVGFSWVTMAARRLHLSLSVAQPPCPSPIPPPLPPPPPLMVVMHRLPKTTPTTHHTHSCTCLTS